MAVCIVQGASRGIGLQFCRSLLSRGNLYVVATCRQPDQASDLQKLRDEKSDNLLILPLDVTKEQSISDAASQVQNQFGKVDLLINSAGILHPSGRGETSLKAVTSDGLMQTFMTNTVGPLMMVKHFSPLLSKGDGVIGKQSNEKKTKHTSVIVNMSAKVGSITDNGLGGWYSYRLSKSALNMTSKNLSIELGRGQARTVCISLHPGTVDTALSRPYHKNVKNLLSVEDSVEMMLKVIDSLSMEDSGKFFTYDRTVLPF